MFSDKSTQQMLRPSHSKSLLLWSLNSWGTNLESWSNSAALTAVLKLSKQRQGQWHPLTHDTWSRANCRTVVRHSKRLWHASAFRCSLTWYRQETHWDFYRTLFTWRWASLVKSTKLHSNAYSVLTLWCTRVKSDTNSKWVEIYSCVCFVLASVGQSTVCDGSRDPGLGQTGMDRREYGH